MKMFSKKKHENKSYGVIGLGRFGMALAMELAQADADLLVIDIDEEKARDFREFTDNVYVVRGYDRKALMATGIQDCDVAVVCIGAQLEVSILMTLNLISLGIPRVIAKAHSEEHGMILEKLGAEVVYPERDMGVRLAHRLESAHVLDYIQLSSKIDVTKIRLPERLAGKTVQAADLRGRFALNIVAIEQKDGSVIDVARPDYVFRDSDILYLAGGSDNINRLTDWAEQ